MAGTNTLIQKYGQRLTGGDTNNRLLCLPFRLKENCVEHNFVAVIKCDAVKVQILCKRCAPIHFTTVHIVQPNRNIIGVRFSSSMARQLKKRR